MNTHTHTRKKKNLMSICFVLELITRPNVVYLKIEIIKY